MLKRTLLVLFLQLIAVNPEAVVGQPPTVDSIRVLYGESVSDINTLDVRFTLKYAGSVVGRDGKKRNAGDEVHSWRYVKDQEKFFLQETLPDGTITPAAVWNGELFLSAGTAVEGQPPQERTMQFRKEIPREYYSNYQLANILGIETPLTTLPLTLHLENTVVEPTENPWEFSLGLQETIYNEKLLMKVSFDPDHDFLPLRISYRRESSQDWVRDWEVTRYEEYSDNQGSKRWMPAEFKIDQGEEYPQILLVVKECKINEEIPSSLFDPPVGQGTSVMNVDTSEVFVAGGNAAADQRVSEIVRGVSGKGSSINWPAILAIVAILSIGAVIALRNQNNGKAT